MKKIKLIWDFRGIDALQTAKHQRIHLEEFVKREKFDISIFGYESISDIHAIAYLVVDETEMKTIRDILKPHRVEYWIE